MNKEPKLKTFICEMCGKEFFTDGNRAKYCYDCRIERQKQRSRAYSEKKRNNEQVRSIGDTDICIECGKPYVVKSGSQKVCDNCRKQHTNKLKQKPNAEYSSRTYDYLRVYVPKGDKAKIKEFADKHNISVNKLINLGLQMAMDRLEQSDE